MSKYFYCVLDEALFDVLGEDLVKQGWKFGNKIETDTGSKVVKGLKNAHEI